MKALHHHFLACGHIVKKKSAKLLHKSIANDPVGALKCRFYQNRAMNFLHRQSQMADHSMMLTATLVSLGTEVTHRS